MDIQVTQTNEGWPWEYRPHRYGNPRIVQVGREWEVRIDGELVGFIEYTQITRETRSKGRTYVNTRWRSPGWRYAYGHRPNLLRGTEVPSKKQAIERIVRDWEWDHAHGN